MDAQITYLGHSSVRLTLPDGRCIYIDPWLADNPKCPKSEHQPKRCDYIVTTHGHFDHVGAVPALVQRFKPKVIAAFELAVLLEGWAPGAEYLPMGIGGTQQVDGISVSLTRAFHSSGFQAADGFKYAGMPSGVVIRADGVPPVYHAGDTDVFSDMQFIEELYAPKVLMLPIGDHFTMGPRGAARAARFFKPNLIIPIHYGTFPLLTGTPEAFRDQLGDQARCLRPLAPGESVAWA